MDDQRRENHNVVKGNAGEIHHPSNSAHAQCVNTSGESAVPNTGGDVASLFPIGTQVAPVERIAVQPSAGQPQDVRSTTNPEMMNPQPFLSLARTSQAQLNSEDLKQGVTEAQSVAEENVGVKDDESESSSKKKPKKDRSKLRKGKWTPEEEEYTSRIIHYFHTGILTLLEGKTLRAHLAEKLNCDPMRITKKYAGTFCLGKRVYHLCERAPPSVTDVEMVKADLAQLEQRFRLRVEYGQSCIPLPPRNNFLPGASIPFAQLRTLAAANPPAPGVLLGNPVSAALAPTGTPAPPAAFSGSVLPLLASNAFMSGAMPGLPMLPPNDQMNPLAALAWAQAAALLTPVLSHLAAANLQKSQQELQKAFEDSLKSITQQSATGTTTPAPPAPSSLNLQPKLVDAVKCAPQPIMQRPADSAKTVANVKTNDGTPKVADSPRSKEDEDAGSMLLGFLSSLQKGYEEALSEREQIEEKATSSIYGQKRRADDILQASKRPRIPAARPSATERAETESGTTSYPAESSLEDSDDAEKGKTSSSDDKNSSSEDSDKDYLERDSSGERGSLSGEGGSGPPRKRMKDKHNVAAQFTMSCAADQNKMLPLLVRSGHETTKLSKRPICRP